jgi:hypothetical protein
MLYILSIFYLLIEKVQRRRFACDKERLPLHRRAEPTTRRAASRFAKLDDAQLQSNCIQSTLYREHTCQPSGCFSLK